MTSQTFNNHNDGFSTRLSGAFRQWIRKNIIDFDPVDSEAEAERMVMSTFAHDINAVAEKLAIESFYQK